MDGYRFNGVARARATPSLTGVNMITKEDVNRLVDEDTNFIESVYRYYVGHIQYMRWHTPEYNEDLTDEFVLKHWDKIAEFMRGKL